MKKYIVMTIVLIIMAAAGTATAAAPRIGYVDIASLFDQFSETRDAKIVLEKDIKAKQEVIQQKSDEIKKMREELEAEQETISPEDKKTSSQEIDRKAQELQKFTEDSEKELAQKESDLTQKILAKIYAAVQQVGKSKEFSLILDKNNVIYGVDSWNITDLVLRTLERGLVPLSNQTSGYMSMPNVPAEQEKKEEPNPYRLNIKEE